MNLVAVIIIAVAAYRVARVFVMDVILDEPRNRIVTWLNEGGRVKGYFLDLLSCMVCFSFWTATFIYWAWVLFSNSNPQGTMNNLIMWWAVAGAASLLSLTDGKLVED